MPPTLRVDPSRLRQAAAAQADVGAFVSGTATGDTFTTAAGGMGGLLSGEACVFAGGVFDGVEKIIGAELGSHSVRLATAADVYHRADEELGRRLRRLAP